MIRFLEGKIQYIDGETVVVNVGGVGYGVLVHEQARANLSGVGSAVSLYIYTQVREDILQLYGFMDQDQLRYFESLLAVTGIGPKAALLISGSVPLSLLQKAAEEGESSELQKVPGIGKKTANRLLLEMKDVLPNLRESQHSSDDSDILSALQTMGYTRTVALSVLSHVSGDTVEAKIASALQLLGKRS